MSRTRSLVQLEERVESLENWREDRQKELEAGEIVIEGRGVEESEEECCPDCAAVSVMDCICSDSEDEKKEIGQEEEEKKEKEEEDEIIGRVCLARLDGSDDDDDSEDDEDEEKESVDGWTDNGWSEEDSDEDE